jgi:sortase (surface protein transpeptidase)
VPHLPRPALLAAGVLVVALSGCSDAPSSAAPAPPSASPSASPSPASSEPAFSAVRELARAEVPARLRIPSLGVDAPVGPVGKAADGTVEVPTRWEDVGWYDAGARPGEDGPTVLLGHVDSKAGPAVFARLPQAPPGTVVELVGDGGGVTRWRVERTEQHPKTRFPTEAVYLPALQPELRLVTCGGAFDRATGHYVDNVVVSASLVAQPG